ncbi:MFS transporter [Novosphingobium flavum]|uniref:MFS transporter n=2 Tax=Novosphingobium flavum TaxID=1778672 RepID=A0A7X1FTF9_9SPHN|nr:MFS transporter [Novosphingobium flavum]
MPIVDAGSGAQPTGKVARPLVAKLVAMMLLEFAVFGSWFATLGLVLSTHGAASVIGQAYFLSAIAAIVSPLFMGAVGDRFLAPRNLLSLLHLASAAIITAIPSALQGGDLTLTLVLIFCNMLFFQPTLGMVNAIALVELGEHQRIFPYIRVFGPLGWALAGICVGALGLSSSTGVFYFAAASSTALALVAQTLPKRPPPSVDSHFSLGDLVGARAFVLFRNRGFAVLMFCALLTSISLGIYNTFASPYLAALGIKNVAGVLAMGQLSELVFIVTIPFALSRIGMKWSLLLGMGLWGVRFALFILAAHGLLGAAYLSVIMHGICSDYFIVVAAMFIARCATPDLAAQAQSWLVLMISGFGAAIGSASSGKIFAAFVAPNAASGAVAWTPLLLLPLCLGAITCAVWIVLFPSARNSEADSVRPTAPLGGAGC